MQTVEINPRELVEYDGNAKIHSRKQINAIKASIENFGFVNPVVAWHNGDGQAEIVCGHGRVEAALLLELDKVPVVFVDHLNDDQRRALTLIDNQTSIMTGMDEDKLKAELERIENIDFGKYDFNVEEIEQVEFEQDELPEEIEPKCKPGQLWQLGEHRLICGSCLDEKIMSKLMGEDKARLLLTDPPYNVGYVGKRTQRDKIANDKMGSVEFEKFLSNAFKNAKQVCADRCGFYVWCSSIMYRENIAALQDNGYNYRHDIVWVKNNFVISFGHYNKKHEPCLYGWIGENSYYFINDKSLSTVEEELTFEPEKASKEELVKFAKKVMDESYCNVWRESKRVQNSKEHPTMKPVSLFGKSIVNSTKKGDIVLDIFAGSGTTIIACEQAGRKARCVELEPKYCDVIIRRWEEETGETAVLLDA